MSEAVLAARNHHRAAADLDPVDAARVTERTGIELRGPADLDALRYLDLSAPSDEAVATEMACERPRRRSGRRILRHASVRREHAHLPRRTRSGAAGGHDLELIEDAEIRTKRRDVGLGIEQHVRRLSSVVVRLDRQQRSLDAERGEQTLLLRIWLDGRHRLLHAAEGDRACLVALELDRDEAAPRLEAGPPALGGPAEHERRPEHRMSR